MLRQLNRADRLVAVIDQGLKSVLGRPVPARPSPAAAGPEPPLSAAERESSARLLRVNRAGEIAAQALYGAQAVFARDPATTRHLEQAAAEESDHLAWCSQRLDELGGRPSRLDPLWYFGSAVIGAAAGMVGDGTSLGFVAETERQVEAHIADHLRRLPAADTSSRAILEQMGRDEARHGSEASAAGGAPIREPVRSLMTLGGEILRRIAYRL